MQELKPRIDVNIGHSLLVKSASARFLASNRAWSVPICAGLDSRKLYIFYIHPEFRIADCRFGSGKGAGLL